MRIVPWKGRENWLEPFQEFEDLRSEMNRAFDFDFPRPLSRARKGETFWAPAVDIADEKDHIIVKADIPGMTKDQIEVSVHNDVLTIKGEKRQEKETKEKDYVRTERFYGSFHRSFSLPTQVDSQNVKATYKDGVLEIVLPKKEGARPKQIKVDIK